VINPDPIIKIQNVNFKYESTPILKNVNLTFKRGGFHLIIGPNGGGKTTLLNLILGLKTPSSGSILINNSSPKEHRSKIGYLPQALAFDPMFPLSVKEFVLMGSLSQLKWYGTWPKTVKQKADTLLDSVSMADFKDQQIGSLSGGQRQRASMARALMNDPDILLLDEPTTGLDIQAFSFIQKELIRLKGQKTIIMVSHMIADVIDEVDDITSVQCEIEKIAKQTVCNHYKLGMYHMKDK